jgi:hypothetical protein
MLNLSEEDRKRIDKEAVKQLIKNNEKQLKVWSLSSHMRKKIEDEIKELETLL